MKKITLTEAQIAQIKESLEQYHDCTDKFDFEIDFTDDNLAVQVKGWIEVESYCEDDYHCGYGKGTGAWVESYRNADVELTGEQYDDNGSTKVSIADESIKEIYEYLNAA